MASIEECYIPEPNTGCWLWTASLNENGYGRRWYNGREQKAHRVVYEMYCAKIPDGMEPDHICNVRSCVNPDHIRIVTHQQNTQRSGLRRRASECKRGHPLSPPNIYIVKGKYRRCRQCVIDRARSHS